jgi:TFIIF-interacting CTD phosphatase-like protein
MVPLTRSQKNKTADVLPNVVAATKKGISSNDEGKGTSDGDDLVMYNDDDATDRNMAKGKTYPSTLIVVLDLDGTLVRAAKSEEDLATGAEIINVLMSGNRQVPILLRPGAAEFLKKTTERYETHIFTAGYPCYADPVLDERCKRIGNPNAFAGRLHNPDCEKYYAGNYYFKPLTRICANMKRIVHEDDDRVAFLFNPENGILVKEFFRSQR